MRDQHTSLTVSGVAQTGTDVTLGQGREVRQDFFMRHSRGQIGEHIRDSDTQSANRRLTTSLAWLQRNDVMV